MIIHQLADVPNVQVNAEGELWDGDKLWDYLVDPASMKSRVRAKQIFKALGATDEQIATGELDFTDFLDHTAQVRLAKDKKQDDSEGRKIAKYIPA